MFAMSHLTWIVIVPGLLLASSCEQNSADRTPGKVAPADVHRDAGQACSRRRKTSRKVWSRDFKSWTQELTRLREKGRDLQDEAKADWVGNG